MRHPYNDVCTGLRNAGDEKKVKQLCRRHKILMYNQKEKPRTVAPDLVHKPKKL